MWFLEAAEERGSVFGSVQQHGWLTGTYIDTLLRLLPRLVSVILVNLTCYTELMLSIIALPYHGSLWVRRKLRSVA